MTSGFDFSAFGRLAAVSAGAYETETSDDEELAAARRLKIKTPPNSVLLALTKRSTVPPEIEDIQEQRPW